MTGQAVENAATKSRVITALTTLAIIAASCTIWLIINCSRQASLVSQSSLRSQAVANLVADLRSEIEILELWLEGDQQAFWLVDKIRLQRMPVVDVLVSEPGCLSQTKQLMDIHEKLCLELSRKFAAAHELGGAYKKQDAPAPAAIEAQKVDLSNAVSKLETLSERLLVLATYSLQQAYDAALAASASTLALLLGSAVVWAWWQPATRKSGRLLDTTTATELDKTLDFKEQTMFRYAVDWILIIQPDTTIVRSSSSVEKILGYSLNEVSGGKLADFTAGSSDAFNQSLSIARSQDYLEFEQQFRHRDGHIVDLLWTAHWSPTEGTLVCIGRDITHRYESEKLKREFVAIISHELKTPLLSMELALQLINKGAFGQLPTELTRRVDVLLSETRRLSRLVNDLLFVEKMQSGKFELCLLDTAIDELFAQAAEAVSAYATHFQVRIVVNKSGLYAHADGTRIIQVLINLLSNALKFSSPGSEVEVSAQELSGEVRVSIADRGRGIPPEALERIFMKYEQVDPSDSSEKGGTGLGLTIVRAIIEQHGGRIWAERNSPVGSTFFFTLPSGKIQDGNA